MEERARILSMVAEGKISADEAERLLSALEDGELNHVVKKGRARWLKVRVYKNGSDKPNVKVNIPLALLKMGAKIGGKLNINLPEKARREMAEKGINLSGAKDLPELEKILDGLAAEGPFKLADVEDDDERVEVFLE